jgi:hypothetical protein
MLAKIRATQPLGSIRRYTREMNFALLAFMSCCTSMWPAQQYPTCQSPHVYKESAVPDTSRRQENVIRNIPLSGNYHLYVHNLPVSIAAPRLIQVHQSSGLSDREAPRTPATGNNRSFLGVGIDRVGRDSLGLR